MAFLDGSAESGMVFKGDLCLAEKSESITAKKEAVCFRSFLHQQEKGRVLWYARKKLVACSCEEQGSGESLPETNLCELKI